MAHLVRGLADPIHTLVNMLIGLLFIGLSYNEAVTQLKFSHRGAAKQLKTVIDSARANAENLLGLNPDRLVVGMVFT